MIKVKLITGDFILGIAEKEIKRLQAGEPISVALGDDEDSQPHVLIMYGATMDDAKKEIEKLTGQTLPDIPSEVTNGLRVRIYKNDL